MTGADLAAEYLDALGRTKPHDLLHLQRAGVGPVGLAIAPAVATISLSSGGLYYQPDPDSDAAAYILPVRGDNPTSPEAADPVAAVRGAGIVDLLAFSAAYPARWALRTGAAAWIGAVEPQYLMPDPTPVWRSPLHWLGQDCRGLPADPRQGRALPRLDVPRKHRRGGRGARRRTARSARSSLACSSCLRQSGREVRNAA